MSFSHFKIIILSSRDDVKIFDFGLSRELKDDLKAKGNDNLYNLTAETGSPRYMAPEVAMGKPYNQKCDTYSFCVIMWEMLALKTPYECYTMKKLKERVFSDMEKRPLVDKKWPESIQQLLAKGWTNNVSQRLTMGEVEAWLRKEVDDEDDPEARTRRRSTFVFDKKTPSPSGATASQDFRESGNKLRTQSKTLQMKIAEELHMSDSEEEEEEELVAKAQLEDGEFSSGPEAGGRSSPIAVEC